MAYRVFGASINKLFGVFPTAVEAMRLVHNVLSGDEDDSDDLAVSREADDGRFAPPLTGAALRARVDEVLAEQQRAKVRGRQVAPHVSRLLRRRRIREHGRREIASGQSLARIL